MEERVMKKQLISSAVAASILAIALAGCGNTDGGSGEASAKTSSDLPASESAASSGGAESEASAAQTGSVTTKTVHMGDREIQTEVVDIGKKGTFSYWSCFTGDSATWEQERVDAFNEAYADLGIQCELQFVPDGAGRAG